MAKGNLLSKIAILGIAGAAIYYIRKKISQLQEDIDFNRSNFQEYVDEQAVETISPAEKYIKIFPYVDFSNITNNEWTGIVRFDITNTSSNYTFTITRLKANLYILGYLSDFMPGVKGSFRLTPGQKITLAATYQIKRWYAAGNVAAKDAIRQYLRADEHYDKWNSILKSDVQLTIANSGFIGEQKFNYRDLTGYVKLRSGVTYWQNQGENAADWDE